MVADHSQGAPANSKLELASFRVEPAICELEPTNSGVETDNSKVEPGQFEIRADNSGAEPDRATVETAEVDVESGSRDRESVNFIRDHGQSIVATAVPDAASCWPHGDPATVNEGFGVANALGVFSFPSGFSAE